MTGRQSHPIFQEPKIGLHGQAILLYQDFHNHLIPIRRRVPDAYQLFSEGVSPQQVTDSLSLDKQFRPSIERFLEKVASKLLSDFEVWIEVATPTDKSATPFALFDVDGVKRTKSGRLTQELPGIDEVPDWAREQGGWGAPIALDEDRMVHVPLPESYPRKVLSKVFRDLSKVSSPVTQSWVMESLSGQQPGGTQLDIGEAHQTERLRILQAVLPIGWTAREGVLGDRKQISHYYELWRQLRFLHFRASMRQRAEEALRDVLTLASERFCFSVDVWAHGVYTPEQIRAIIRIFEAGELGFDAAFETIFETERDGNSERRRIV